MARIRTIKPEFSMSEQICKLSHSARLLFVLMWGHCDDDGYHFASLIQLKNEIFPADPLTTDDMRRLINELIVNELIVERQSNEDKKTYWQVLNFRKHQKIDRPSNAKHPQDLDIQKSTPALALVETDFNRRVLDECSTGARVVLVPGREGKGGEGNVMEGNGVREKEGAPKCGQLSISCGYPVDNYLLEIPTRDGIPFSVNEKLLTSLKDRFPTLDVEARLIRIKDWTFENPEKQRRHSDMHRYVNDWLRRDEAKLKFK